MSVMPRTQKKSVSTYPFASGAAILMKNKAVANPSDRMKRLADETESH